MFCGYWKRRSRTTFLSAPHSSTEATSGTTLMENYDRISLLDDYLQRAGKRTNETNLEKSSFIWINDYEVTQFLKKAHERI